MRKQDVDATRKQDVYATKSVQIIMGFTIIGWADFRKNVAKEQVRNLILWEGFVSPIIYLGGEKTCKRATKRAEYIKDMNTTATVHPVAHEYRIIAARHACGFPHEARAENAMRFVRQGLWTSAGQTLKI